MYIVRHIRAPIHCSESPSFWALIFIYIFFSADTSVPHSGIHAVPCGLYSGRGSGRTLSRCGAGTSKNSGEYKKSCRKKLRMKKKTIRMKKKKTIRMKKKTIRGECIYI